MKRKIEASTEKHVKSPTTSKADERQFGEAMQYMIEQMAKRFRNQVLLELNQGTINKFNDAQTGNFASILLALSKKTKRKILKQFSNKRLQKLGNKYTTKIDKKNAGDFYAQVEKQVGISQKELEETEGLNSQINAFKLETSQWITKLRDETLEQWTTSTLRSMAEGESIEEIMQRFDGMTEKRKGHADMIARTQIGTFNSLVSKTRARNLGIEKAMWVTSRDERVRPSHIDRNNKEFDLAKGLYSSIDKKTLLPAVDYNCRCDYIMIIPEME